MLLGFRRMRRGSCIDSSCELSSGRQLLLFRVDSSSHQSSAIIRGVDQPNVVPVTLLWTVIDPGVQIDDCPDDRVQMIEMIGTGGCLDQLPLRSNPSMR
jgi:hypothetical protein